MTDHLPVLIVVTPLLTAFILFVIGWWNERACYPVTVLSLAGCLAASGIILNSVLETGTIEYRVGGWPPPFGIELHLDHLNGFMLILICFFGLAGAIYGKKSIEKELSDRIALFWSLYMLLITGLLGIAVTGDIFNLFVLLEVSSLTGYALVAVASKEASVAGLRYLIIGTIGASFYLLGVGHLYIAAGSLNMADLRELLPPLYDSRIVRTAFVFMFIGFAIKIALFPLHGWQPDTYTHAPSVVSVIISTAMAKTFVYALIRVVFSVFTIDFVRQTMIVLDLICWIAAIGMVAGSIFAMAQENLKRMLAYSSVANTGYIVLAVGLSPSTSLGLAPAVMHIINHATIKACMFMAACAFIHKLGLSNIRDMAGLGRRMPLSSLALILGGLAMIGMPPSAGFVTKWYLILAALEAGKFIFVAVIFFSTLLMIIYFWRVIEIVYIRAGKEENFDVENGPVRAAEAPSAMAATTLTMGFLTFILGILWLTGAFAPLVAGINAEFGLGVTP